MVESFWNLVLVMTGASVTLAGFAAIIFFRLWRTLPGRKRYKWMMLFKLGYTLTMGTLLFALLGSDPAALDARLFTYSAGLVCAAVGAGGVAAAGVRDLIDLEEEGRLHVPPPDTL